MVHLDIYQTQGFMTTSFTKWHTTLLSVTRSVSLCPDRIRSDRKIEPVATQDGASTSTVIPSRSNYCFHHGFFPTDAASLHVRLLSCTSWFSQTELAAHQAQITIFERDYHAGGSGGTSISGTTISDAVQLIPETPLIAHKMLLTFALLCVHEYPCPCSSLI